VRTDKVQEVPDSWADLWDPQYAGHVALWDSGESNHTMTALSLGIDPWNATPAQEERIKQKLIDIKPNLLTYWADYTEAVQLAISGDAWLIANAWPDAYKLALDEGADPSTLAYIEPAEGRLGWLCGFGISSKATNVDLAYEYIDATIAPESMAALSNEYAYGASNADALPLTDPDFVSPTSPT
jgi:spermidine/putrescine-binding protein